MNLPNMAFLGGGNMARAIIAGLVHAGGVAPLTIDVIEHNALNRAALEQDFGVRSHADVDAYQAHIAAGGAEASIWLLAVKPQVMEGALAELAAHLPDGRLLVSVAAGLSCASLSRWAGAGHRIVRTMPNTPALVGKGVTGVYAPDVSPEERAWVEAIAQSIGRAVWLDEEADIDAITAISGSGPAYVFAIMEAFIAHAERLGFDASSATELVMATFDGALTLAQQADEPIGVLRERVTSKGGTTAAALAAFAEHDLAAVLGAGVDACYARAGSLALELSGAPHH